MQVDRLAAFTVSPGRSGYDAERSATVYARIAEALRELPATSHVASSMVPLLSNNDWGTNLSIEGRDNSDADASSSLYNLVGDDYFEALGIAVLTGRAFAPADAGSERPKVAVVNRRFVEKFGLAQPVGTRMAIGQQDELDIEIVGVVADSTYSDPRQAAPALFYLPHAQHAAQGSMTFYLRSARPPEALLAQLPGVVAAIDPDLPVEGVRTLRQQIEQTLVAERFVGLLSAAFALLSTLLAALGLYGVLSYTLSQRMREIGLRLALGAAPARVSRMLMRQVTRMTFAGAVVGLAVALAAGRAAQSLLFGLDSHDPWVLGGALLLLVTVALGSGWLPARRAGRVDPMMALRHD
jgi:predicted permease